MGRDWTSIPCWTLILEKSGLRWWLGGRPSCCVLEESLPPHWSNHWQQMLEMGGELWPRDLTTRQSVQLVQPCHSALKARSIFTEVSTSLFIDLKGKWSGPHSNWGSDTSEHQMGGHFTAEESQPKNLLLWSLLNGESDSKQIHTDQNFWTEAVQD